MAILKPVELTTLCHCVRCGWAGIFADAVREPDAVAVCQACGEPVVVDEQPQADPSISARPAHAEPPPSWEK
jgi:hypothetical protein